MPFNTGLSGLKAANSELRITGNNIANASTNGFKESRAEFADVYAASVLGTGGNAIGTGVRLSTVAQQFTQGTVTFTDNNLDLAINGQGFFKLDLGGETLYSRAGAFSVDNGGNIVNSDGAKLQGYQLLDTSNQPDADPEGVIGGAIGDLRLDTANIAPVATTGVTTTLNLNSSDSPPASTFTTGFSNANPPSSSSYNDSTSVTIYDSLGNAHIMTMYFVKDESFTDSTESTENVNKWQLFVGINGEDVTPSPSTAVPTPFSLQFDNSGKFIVNDPAIPPVIGGPATVTTTTAALVNTGVLPILNTGELTINGVAIPAATADSVSTSDDTASAKAIAEAIAGTTVSATGEVNSILTGLTTLKVQVEPATISLGTFTPPTVATAFGAGDLVINGINITDTDGAGGTIGSAADLVTAIDYHLGAANIPIRASNSSGVISLTVADNGTGVADGRNIQITTDGTVADGTLSAFSLQSAQDKVIRGGVRISETGSTPITIGGNTPLDGGFTPGTSFSAVSHSNSDAVSFTWTPPEGNAEAQTITIDLSASTQFGSPFAVQSLLQNGSTTGRLAGVDADDTGILFARFTNGRSRKLGQIVLSNFSNPQGLQPQGNTNWSETFSSGSALDGAPQTSNLGAIQSGGLEDSNVKLTEELVDLIIAQRNFQANAQTIRTADTVTQTIINIR